jgi:ribose/xylose/arabinose/galactoside ABC-type transport system permease subunit
VSAARARAAGAAPAARHRHPIILVWRIFDRLGPLLMLLLILAGMSVAYPGFVTADNLLTIGLQATTRAILAIGVTLVIVSGGVDLSVGTVMSLAMVAMGAAVIDHGLPLALGLLVPPLVGAAAGIVNGALIAFGGLPPFIATLGMLGIAQGLALTLSNGLSMYGFPPGFELIGGGQLVGLPVPVLILALVAGLMLYVFHQTPTGRYAFGLGGNEEAVRRSGIAVPWLKVRIYVISGALAGVASVVLASRINSAHPGVGFGYELDAIAAAVIGGASLSGGRGTVLGAIVGALIMATIRFGLNVLGMSPFLQQIAVGAILIVAVLLDNLRSRQDARLDKLWANR